MQTPFDDALFEAVDEEGRAYTCRALLCFERENKFFVLYIEEGAEPVPQSLRAGYCDITMLEDGATVPLFPLENEQQWGWIQEQLKEKIVDGLREMFNIDLGEDEPSLFFDSLDSLDGDDLFDMDEEFDAERDLYAPDADGNYLS